VDNFFDNGKLASLKLTFDQELLESYTDAEHPEGYSQDQWLDLLWNKWNNHCGPYEWVPARMEYESPDHDGDVTLERVSVRLRGTRSRGVNPLAGFKIDFTKSLPGSATRRFAGLSRVNVLSNEKDDSNMVQCMGYKLMRDFGLPAPMCNHLRVYVNGKLYGLIENVERAKDARFLKHHFGTSDGPLYAASATCGFTDSLADLEFKGDSYDNGKYPGIYEILRGSPADAEANLIPMLKCGDQVQTPDDEEFKACISDWIDVDQWLKVIAGESLIPSVEDFFGARRNFYLYFLPDAEAPHGGRMKVWGWDYDTVLQRSTCLPSTCDPFTSVTNWYGPLGKRQKLVVRLTKVFKQQYCGHLNTFLTDVYDASKVDAMASVIEPAMVEDPVVTEDRWRAEVTRMRDYMTKHATDMATVVEKACAETP
jgi:spore coat protein CotH